MMAFLTFWSPAMLNPSCPFRQSRLELDRSVELSDDQIYLQSRTGAPVGEGKPLTVRLIGSNLFDQKCSARQIIACLNPPSSLSV
jgi:hypothetical protein